MRMHAIVPTAGVLVMLFAGQSSAGPVVVSCAPGQHAVVRDTLVRGEAVTRVSCAAGSGYRDVSYRTRYVTDERIVRPRRSWGKSALVIGGSAATGAGLGGIVRGKKGALIGGTLGAGAASLFEAARRR